MIKAIIFDMGGTLLHFERPGSGSWRELETPGIRGIYRYLVGQGQPIAAHEDEFVAVMFSRLAEGWDQSTGGHVSMRAHDWIARVVADHALTLDDATLAEAVRHYARPIRDGVHAAPGAAETLAALRAQGLRVGLVSNTIWPGELHLEDLAEAGLLQHLEHTIFSGDLGIWKPNRAIFEHALHALGVAPHEAVFVGDNPREDILGAQAVGMRGVLVASREFAPGNVEPDAIIHKLPELLPLIASWAAT